MTDRVSPVPGLSATEKTMKKMFAVALVSASLVACGGKRDNTTPVNKASMEQKTDATGGAAYGGKNGKPDGTPPANPCAPK